MRLLVWVSGLLAAFGAMGTAAQQAAPREVAVPTLHVYTNLVQVPTLVLAGNRTSIDKQIEEKRFSISVDSGPWFPVTHARLEGGDPISLSILLDTNADNFLPRIGEAIAGLAPSLLGPRDHVSVYAMGCDLTRSLNDVPAESARLKMGVDAALQPWAMRRQKRDASCEQRPVQLWDALGYIANALHHLPGRRVILVVTDGHDRGSVRLWNEVRLYTQAAGVTVFGVTGKPVVVSEWNNIVLQNDTTSFQAICELSGGLMTMTEPAQAGRVLQQTMTMVRKRYIVEFPRPSNSTEGAHDLRIRIEKGDNYFIRPSGISVPLPDPTLEKDPSTVQSDPLQAPEQGNRRILPNPKR